MKRIVSIAGLCVALLACGDGFGRASVPDGSVTDSSLDDVDGTLPEDGSTGADTGGPLEANGEPLPARDGTALAPSRIGMDACYAEGACDDDGCGDVRSCCVGAATCCAPMGADPAPSLDLDGACADFTTAADCLLPGMTPFGDPLPYVFDNAIVPNGDVDGDSGLLADMSVDLTVHQAVLRGVVHTPIGCGAGCLETVGLGMTAQSDVNGSVRVIASLLYSAARDRMTLMIDDAQVGAWSEISDGEEWALSFLPSGTIEVLRDGELVPDFEPPTFRPHPSARLVVYGHTVNPTSGGEPSRIENVRMDVSLCDVPDAWTDRSVLPVTVSGGGTLMPSDQLTAPTLLRGTRTLLAWEQDGAIWLAEDSGSGFVAQAMPVIAAEPSEAWRSEAVGDPELVERADESGYTLFFTAHESDGLPSIGRLDLDTELEPVVGGEARVIASGAIVEADELSEPTVWQYDPMTWVMIARAVENGVAHLRVLRSNDAGQNWSYHRSAALEAHTARNGTRATSGFDTDDIGHPSLVTHNGAWQLHYAGRRGTRTGIGLLLSDDLVNWRFHEPGEAVLAPGVSDDERVGVSAPDVVVESFGLTMYYVADDGYQRRLYSTSRRATDSGTF